jgi:hypothetical protein
LKQGSEYGEVLGKFIPGKEECTAMDVSGSGIKNE